MTEGGKQLDKNAGEILCETSETIDSLKAENKKLREEISKTHRVYEKTIPPQN